MTPQEKAKELVEKMIPFVELDVRDSDSERENAKQCALIAVNEIVEFLLQASKYLAFPQQIIFWQEVKQEIQKL